MSYVVIFYCHYLIITLYFALSHLRKILLYEQHIQLLLNSTVSFTDSDLCFPISGRCYCLISDSPFIRIKTLIQHTYEQFLVLF